MKKIERKHVKNVAGFVVRYGTSLIVGGVINAYVQPEKLHQKVGIFAASYVIGDAIGKKLTPTVNENVDDFADAITQIANK